MWRRTTRTCVGIAVLAIALPVRLALAQDGAQDAAEDEPAFGARAEVERPIASRAPLDPTASGTRIEIEPLREQTMREVVGRIPGARVLGTGGAGQFLGLTLRGAELSHTTVLLGDLPLSGPDIGALDLGLLDVQSLGAIEVYRGGAPASLGEGAIGGVVRLLPRRAEESRYGAAISYGSFDRGIARTWASVREGAIASHAMVAIDTADDDYPYFHDGGTGLDPSDGSEMRRAAAHSRGASGLLHLELPAGDGTLEGVVLWIARDGGIPSGGPTIASRTRRSIDRYAGSLAYTLESRVGEHRLRLQVLGGGTYLRSQVLDRTGELGVGARDSDVRQHRAFGRVLGAWTPLRELTLTALVTARRDGHELDDPLATIRGADSERVGTAAVIEAAIDPRIDGVKIALRPSVRLEWSRAGLVDRVEALTQRVTEVFAPTFRLGAAVEPLRGIAIAASVAHGTRLPSMIELFGDRALLLPNVDLVPERAIMLDAGITVQERMLAGALVIEAELRGFASFIEDLIRYRRIAQFTAIAENIERGDTFGVEAGLDLRITPHVRVQGAATFLDARDDLGRFLPLRPGWHGLARADVTTARWLAPWIELGAYVSASYTGRNTVDPANLIVLRERVWIDAGARAAIADGHVGVSFDARDLADARGQDFLGFPLPGRRWAVQMDLQGEW